MNMKAISHIVLLALLLFSFSAISQTITIPGTKVQFNFPNAGWKYLQTYHSSNDATIYLYSYCAKPVVDAVGDTVPPFMRIYVRKNYKESPFDLAYERYSQQPFQSLDEYMDGLPSAEGIGYIGAYTSTTDEKDYQFRMIYFKEGGNALEIRLETTRDTYELMEKEFEQVMKTVKIAR